MPASRFNGQLRRLETQKPFDEKKLSNKDLLLAIELGEKPILTEREEAELRRIIHRGCR